MRAPAIFRDRWARAVRAGGEREFLTFEAADGGGATWSYAGFDALVDEVAGGLVARGAGPGRPVHVALANSPAFVAVWLAAIRMGAVLVPSDPRASARELGEQAARTRAAVGVCAAAREDVYRAGVRGPDVLVVDEADAELYGLRGQAAGAVDLEPSMPAAILFTSGTTAAPKGVVITQANYAFAGDAMAAAAAVRADDRLLVVLPLFHANAQYYSFAAAIAAGASVALMAGFSATRFWAQAARHQATHASLFAAPMRMILARGEPASEPLALRHVWYAQNLAREQYEAFARLAGCRPRQLYGMTETLPAVLTSPALDPVPDAMGEETLGCSVELADVEDGVGEIAVRGRRGVELFAGYLDDPETTERAFRDGAFRTGDLARRDAQGRLTFAGRRGDVLKVAGENVSIVEVETVLNEHPGVLEAAIVGAPDPVSDEVPVAHIVRTADARALGEDELAAWCAQRLAPAKRPRRFVFRAELPRTSVGKIRRFELT